MANQQTDFAHHMDGRAQEQIERAGHHAFGRVFHTDHAVLRSSGGGGVKDFVKVGAVDEVGGASKKFDRRLLAKRALGTKHRHALWGFERQTSRHDFAPDGGDVFILEGARIGLGDFVDDLRYPVWPKER